MPFSIPGSNMLVDEYDVDHYIKRGSIPNGAPETTAGLFAPGALITSLQDSIIYQNNGTTAVPVWEEVPAVRTKIVELTAAQLIAMYATPVEIIPAVPGKAIILESLILDILGTATQFTGGGVVGLQYDDTANGAGTLTHADIAAAVVTGATGTVRSLRIPVVQSAIAAASINGLGLYLSNQTAAFATGTGTAKVTVKYYVV